MRWVAYKSGAAAGGGRRQQQLRRRRQAAAAAAAAAAALHVILIDVMILNFSIIDTFMIFYWNFCLYWKAAM
jgi:hypothetical protein